MEHLPLNKIDSYARFILIMAAAFKGKLPTEEISETSFPLLLDLLGEDAVRKLYNTDPGEIKNKLLETGELPDTVEENFALLVLGFFELQDDITSENVTKLVTPIGAHIFAMDLEVFGQLLKAHVDSIINAFMEYKDVIH